MKTLFIVLSLVIAGSTFADQTMTKIVFRQEAESVVPGSWGAKAKTIYRSGDTQGRIEQAPDLDHHIPPLMIFSGKDAWIIESDQTGHHLVDPSADHNFYAPIVPPEKPNEESPLREFEIGKEIIFMKERHIQPKATDKDDILVYECVEKGYTLQTYVSGLAGGVPTESRVLKNGTLVLRLIYDSYQIVPVDPSLFEPPTNVKISEG